MCFSFFLFLFSVFVRARARVCAALFIGPKKFHFIGIFVRLIALYKTTEITNVIDTRKNYVAANEANSEAESMSLSGSRTINTPLTNLALFITALSIMAFAT